MYEPTSLAKTLEQWLRVGASLPPNPELAAVLQRAEFTTGLFADIIVAVLALGLLLCVSRRLPRLQGVLPTTLTTLGILGTFLGIVVGLLAFDPAHIDSSIAGLLEGLKTAFLTSVVGVAASVVLKLVQSLLPPKQTRAERDDARPVEQLLAVLREGNEALGRIENSLSDAKESSVVGQVKAMRTDLADRHRAMEGLVSGLATSATQSVAATDKVGTAVAQLEGSVATRLDSQATRFSEFSTALDQRMVAFAEMLSKSATEQVVEALNQVIRDFNRNLTEQFGENFKALDASVGKLVDWQDNYKGQLADMAHKYQLGVDAIATSETALSSISTSAATIPTHMQGLGKVLGLTRHQIDDLGRHLGAFEEMKTNAVNAVPVIEERINQTVAAVTTAANDASVAQVDSARKLQDGATKMVTLLADGAEDVEKRVQSIAGGLTEAAGAVTTETEKIKTTLGDASRDLNNDLRTLAVSMNEDAQATQQTIRDGAKAVLDGTTQARDALANIFEQAHTQALRHIEEAADQNQSVVRQSVKDTDEARRTMLAGLEALTEDSKARLERLNQQHADALEDGLAGLRTHLAGAGEETRKVVTNGMRTFDELAQSEVTRVLENMGRQLATVTRQFTDDYSQLTDQMAVVVRRAREAA